MAASSQGPFTLVPLGLTSYTDPAVHTPANAKVQLQNNSNMALSVQIGGANFSIAPFTASTIPTNASPTMTVLAGTQTAPTGTLTLAWLQPSDEAPMPDGPIVGVSSVSSNQVLLGSGTVPAMGGPNVTSFLVTVSAANRSIWISFPSGGLSGNKYSIGSVIGQQSGFLYGRYLVSLYSGGNISSFWRIPLVEGMDSTILVGINNGSVFSSPYFYGVDNAITDIDVSNSSNNPLSIANPINSTGNTNPLDVVPYGGGFHATVNTGGVAQLLAAPSAGTSYRVHSVNVFGPSATYLFCRGAAATSLAFATLIMPNTPTLLLNGLLVPTSVYVLQTLSNVVDWNIDYDVVTTPAIT